MSSPKISIIIPVYMAESYLHRCVDSIITQTFTDWELLLVEVPIIVVSYVKNMLPPTSPE